MPRSLLIALGLLACGTPESAQPTPPSPQPETPEETPGPPPPALTRFEQASERPEDESGRFFVIELPAEAQRIASIEIRRSLGRTPPSCDAGELWRVFAPEGVEVDAPEGRLTRIPMHEADVHRFTVCDDDDLDDCFLKHAFRACVRSAGGALTSSNEVEGYPNSPLVWGFESGHEDCAIDVLLDASTLDDDLAAVEIRHAKDADRDWEDDCDGTLLRRIPRVHLELPDEVHYATTIDFDEGCGETQILVACTVDESGRRKPAHGGVNTTTSPPCFAAGTRIDTPTGLRAIETLVVGDDVWAWNGQQVLGTVTQTRTTRNQALLRLRLDDGRSLRVTATHRIRRGNRWVRAGELRAGDPIVLREGSAEVESVSPDGRADVYDLSIAPHATYFAEGMLVHNY